MLRRTFFLPALAVLTMTAAAASDPDPFAARRDALVDGIARHDRMFAAARGRDPMRAEVLAALRRTPRHRFVPREMQGQAYADRPLPIGHGQTISQPYVVALMTDLLRVGPGDTVLEVGTGSGYQAAVLAELGVIVHSIEIVAPLARRARADLADAGYADRVTVHIGDGYAGLPDLAPFDGILVTAAPDHVPQPLLDQLRRGARLVIPVGPQGRDQQLLVVHKDAAGELHTTEVIPVRFVPLTGDTPRRP